MARNTYGGYCRECGRWTPPGFGHFERRGRRWLVHCVECATVYGLEPQEAFETICENLGIKVRYL